MPSESADKDKKHQREQGDIVLLKRYIQKARVYTKPLLMVYLLYFLNATLNLLPAFGIYLILDVIAQPRVVNFYFIEIDFTQYMSNPDNQITWIIYASLIIMGVILVANTIGVIMWRYGTRVSQRFILSLKQEVHMHLHKLSISYFDKERTGSIMSRIVGDVDQMEQMLKNSFGQFYSLLHFVLAPILMIGMSPILFLFLLPPLPIVIFAIWQIRKKLRPMYKRMREQQAEIGASVQEQISGIREIKAFGQQDAAHREYSRANIKYVRTVHESMEVFSLNHQILYGSKDVTMLLIVGGGIWLVISGHAAIGLGAIIAFLPLFEKFFSPIGMLVGFYDVIQRGLAASERVFQFLDIEPDVQDQDDAEALAVQSGSIAFDQVHFAYDDGVPVIKDLSVNIPAGSTVALVGSTGAGKTTIVSLLLRFYQVNKGRILIDGQDIAKIQQHSLHKIMGMVFQDTFLFYGSVAENIAYSRPTATRAEIIAAAKMADIHDFIDDLPEGYDTLVGERGVKLSGGQRQRLAIARMIIKDPKIVILDEATSAVDNKTEQHIQKSLDRLMAGRTAIVIAHRLSTIRNADLILVMEHGELIESGTHDELLAKDGQYAQLHALAEV